MNHFTAGFVCVIIRPLPLWFRSFTLEIQVLSGIYFIISTTLNSKSWINFTILLTYICFDHSHTT